MFRFDRALPLILFGVWSTTLATSNASAQPKNPAQENPFEVSRTFPDYLLEHRKLFTEQAGTYKAGPHPVWTVHAPAGWIGNVIFIEGDDSLIVYDSSVSTEGVT